MTPVLVTGYDTGGIVLVVQVPGAVCIDEHAIGIVHEILMAKELALKARGIQMLREVDRYLNSQYAGLSRHE
jgi:hypothetical protein